MRRKNIHLRCDYCGNAKIVERQDYEPDEAVETESNECNICDAASGGYGTETYYDRDGNILPPN